MIVSLKKATSVVVMKLIEAQKTTTIIAAFGTNVSVISWIEVRAWKRPTTTPATSATVSKGAEIMTLPLREARESFEREYLKIQIRRFSGNISKTAEFIGMERSALHRKLKLLGLHDR